MVDPNSLRIHAPPAIALASPAASPKPAEAAALPTPNTAIRDLLDPQQMAKSTTNFKALFEALQNDPDPKVQEQLAVFKEPSVATFTARWDERWDWKEQCKAGTLKPSDDAIRLKIVGAVAELANILASREEDPIPSAKTAQDEIAGGWALFGTKAIKSDVDYAVAHITDTDRPFRDNAIQGRKIAMASLIFTACFQGPSLRLLDTEFYPPHIGTFLKGEMASSASFSAILSQVTHMLGSADLAHFQQHVTDLCIASDMAEIGTLQELVKDCEAMHARVQTLKKQVPDKDLANILCNNKLTMQLAETGERIDMIDKSLKAMNEGPAKAKLISQREEALAYFCYLDALRSQFLPEAFVTRGAFTVVCESQGGQKHQTAHDAIETSFRALAPDKREEALEAVNADALKATEARSERNVELVSVQELLETIGENGAYLHHRGDLVDASKYGVRVYDPAIVLVDKLIAKEGGKAIPDEAFLRTLKTFREDLQAKSVEMSVLESSKRGKFFQKTFKKVVANVAGEDFSLALAAIQRDVPKLAHGTSLAHVDVVASFSKQVARHLPAVALTGLPVAATTLSSQEEVNALWRALFATIRPKAAEEHAAKTAAVADVFFKKAKLGSAQFRVMEPQKRIELLKKGLGVAALGPKMQAIAESVARVGQPVLAQSLLAKTAADELNRMRGERNGVTNDAELFKKVQSEVRETIAKTVVYSLKAGVIKAPEPINAKKPIPRLALLLERNLATMQGVHAPAQAVA